eukprot:350692-Chlamydomonas_euryale.AAC.1
MVRWPMQRPTRICQRAPKCTLANPGPTRLPTRSKDYWRPGWPRWPAQPCVVHSAVPSARTRLNGLSHILTEKTSFILLTPQESLAAQSPRPRTSQGSAHQQQPTLTSRPPQHNTPQNGRGGPREAREVTPLERRNTVATPADGRPALNYGGLPLTCRSHSYRHVLDQFMRRAPQLVAVRETHTPAKTRRANLGRMLLVVKGIQPNRGGAWNHGHQGNTGSPSWYSLRHPTYKALARAVVEAELLRECKPVGQTIRDHLDDLGRTQVPEDQLRRARRRQIPCRPDVARREQDEIYHLESSRAASANHALNLPTLSLQQTPTRPGKRFRNVSVMLCGRHGLCQCSASAAGRLPGDFQSSYKEKGTVPLHMCACIVEQHTLVLVRSSSAQTSSEHRSSSVQNSTRV